MGLIGPHLYIDAKFDIKDPLLHKKWICCLERRAIFNKIHGAITYKGTVLCLKKHLKFVYLMCGEKEIAIISAL